MALTVAREEWKGGWCAEPEQRWPGLIPVTIELAGETPQTVHGYDGAGPGYCFSIEYNLETTPWDPDTGEPSEPRTYMMVRTQEPVCAVVQRATDGDENEPSTWTLKEALPFWWDAPLRQVRDALCARANDCTTYD